MWILSACRDDANVLSTAFGETMTAANRRRYQTVHRKAGNAHVLLICAEQAKVGVTFVYNASLQRVAFMDEQTCLRKSTVEIF
jgi:hypothetical protein